MRAAPLALLALATATPALAQGLPSSNLNSINNSLSQQSQNRQLRQQQQSDTANTRMQIRRSESFRQAPTPAPIVVPKR
ncbi:hypothetical protein U8607_02670 [Methylobacterium durans]|uniref:hypothetical protein n=1 Tax=Methylobacterium durans TaxID=2202825 RepID=UPI002B000FAD|nr:hypothetical protein [Methylobacterium durans]MEA1830973.1 hypothetical protein [Methylobacterium durans]